MAKQDEAKPAGKGKGPTVEERVALLEEIVGVMRDAMGRDLNIDVAARLALREANQEIAGR